MSEKHKHYKRPANQIRCSPQSPDRKIIADAADVVLAGGVVCFPTSCLYGLGADAGCEEAVKRVFEIKQRPPDKPVLVLIDSLERLDRLVARIPPFADELIDRFWPGKLTLVFEARSSVSELLTAGTGKIGVRQPGHPVARAFVSALKRPLTGTSANLSGSPSCNRIEDLPSAIRSQVNLLIDSGELKGGVGSTVVDVSGDRPRLLREGAIKSTAIQY